MNRGLKKFLYGVFYLGVFFIIIWLAFFDIDFSISNSKPAEEKESINLDISDVDYFQIDSGLVSFLVNIENEDERVVNFSYKFILKSNDSIVDEINGNEKIGPLAEEIVLETKKFDKKISEVLFEIDNISYEEKANSIKEDVVINNVKTLLEDERVVVSGIVENKSFIKIEKLFIISILADEYGFRLAGAKNVLEDIPSFESRDFEVFVPVDRDVKENFYKNNTEVYVNLE